MAGTGVLPDSPKEPRRAAPAQWLGQHPGAWHSPREDQLGGRKQSPVSEAEAAIPGSARSPGEEGVQPSGSPVKPTGTYPVSHFF